MRSALAARLGQAGGPEAGLGGVDFLTFQEQLLWDEATQESTPTTSYVGASMLAGAGAGTRKVHWMDEVTLALDIRPIVPSGQRVVPLAPEPGASRLNFAQLRAGVNRARAEGVLPPTVAEPEVFVPPPEGFRAPSRDEFHDTTALGNDQMARVLAGLRSL